MCNCDIVDNISFCAHISSIIWATNCHRQEEAVSRTISLCTGMQSSTLAGLLATQFLGSTQAVPPACSVVAMAIMGLFLASFWGSGYRIRDLPSMLIRQSDFTVKASWRIYKMIEWRINLWRLDNEASAKSLLMVSNEKENAVEWPVLEIGRIKMVSDTEYQE